MYKTEWDLAQIYTSENDPKIESDTKKFVEKYNDFSEKWSKNEKYLEDSDFLLESLMDYESLLETEITPYYYFHLKSELDLQNPDYTAKKGKYFDISIEAGNKVEFYLLNLGKIHDNLQTKFLTDEKLQKYWNFLSDIFENSKYNLTEKEEIVVNMYSKASRTYWVNLRKKQLSKINVNGKSFEEAFALLSSPDKKIRDLTAKKLYKELEPVSEILVDEFNSLLETKFVHRKLRGITRYDEARHVSDSVDSEIVDSLIANVSEYYYVTQRFYKLKAKILGLKKLKYYERNLPYTAKKERKLSFEESVEIVRNSLSKISPEYEDYFVELLKTGKIDVFPKKHKSGGAYCLSLDKKFRSFILLNYTEMLNDAFTLAHETGHAVHFQKLINKQPAVYAGSSLMLAEVASTIFEGFVNDELSKILNDEENFALKLENLTGSMNSVFRQVSFYKMELEFHKQYEEKKYLSAKELGDIFEKYSKEELGDSIEYPEGVRNSWTYVSHFRNPFYVYSYASGELISIALKKIIKDEKSVDKLNTLLEMGSSKSPKDAFGEIGIDISSKDFWILGLKEIEKEITELEILGKKLGKI